MVLIFFTAILFTGCECNAQKTNAVKNSSDSAETVVEDISLTDSIKEISLLFLGDIMQHDLQIQSAYYSDKGAYDFNSQFENVKPIFDTTDVVIGNLEVTLSGPPYKGYPRFSSPDALAHTVKNAGIEYLGFANNHVYDYGQKGFERTLNVLDSLEFVRTGAFFDAADKEKNHPMVINKKGFKIAVFNYTYGVNGDYVKKPNLVNFIDRKKIKADLAESMSENFDARIVFMHWGTEYKRLATDEQKSLEKFCYENGADILIGAHPHVIEPMRFYTFTNSDGKQKQVLTAYSLGNFVSNYATWRYCDGGAMLHFKLRKNKKDGVQIIKPRYHLIWVYRPVRKGKLRRYTVLPVVDFEDDSSIKGEYRRLFDRFINDSRTLLQKHNKNVYEVSGK